MSRKSQRTGPPEGDSSLGIRERGRARRRLRYLRRLRELQLRDAGGFVFDLFRFGERRDALVREKLDALIATDQEVRHLEGLLGEAGRAREIREPGVGGTCASCGAFHGSDARFCARCGTRLKKAATPPVAAEEVPAEPAEEAPRAAPVEVPPDGEVTVVAEPGQPAGGNGAAPEASDVAPARRQ
jgi:hypothetical protein